MTAIITDVHYRMSLAAIRELGERKIRVVCCEREGAGDPIGFYSKYCAASRLLPEDGYADALLALCREIYEAEGEKPALLPVGAYTIGELVKPENKEKISKVCGALLPEKAALDTLNDKEAVARLGRELGIPIPEEYTPGTARFPCVVKPKCGEKFGLSAGERYRIVKNREELTDAREHFGEITGGEPVIQQLLPGDGMGCSLVAEDGRVSSSLCHRRVREYPVTGGPSSCCEAVKNPLLEDYAGRLVHKTGYTGLCMVEFKLDAEGEPRLLEVNPRVWGTFPLTRASRTGLIWEWFRLSWNRGDPERAIPAEARSFKEGKRMAFTATDLAAGAGYFCAGQKRRGLGAIGDLLNPEVADGVWEWGDIKPAARYYKSLLRRGGK